jgi:CRP/FNR family transcriptional regulator, cyclic AMP receptor protein
MRTIDELITDSPTFAGLEPAHLEFIAGCGRNEHVAGGTMLMREGEPADRFWLIRRGVVALELYVPGREPLVIETLEPGDVVGWSWLFAPYRWALDGRAQGECHLITFDGVCLRNKCESDHDLGFALMSRFVADVIGRLQATRLQLADVHGNVSATA